MDVEFLDEDGNLIAQVTFSDAEWDALLAIAKVQNMTFEQLVSRAIKELYDKHMRNEK